MKFRIASHFGVISKWPPGADNECFEFIKSKFTALHLAVKVKSEPVFALAAFRKLAIHKGFDAGSDERDLGSLRTAAGTGAGTACPKTQLTQVDPLLPGFLP